MAANWPASFRFGSASGPERTNQGRHHADEALDGHVGGEQPADDVGEGAALGVGRHVEQGCQEALGHLEPAPSTYGPKVANLNEVIAFNFRAARELRGWTQEEVALRLEPLLGQRLPQASISGIERTYEGDRQREFDAHEILPSTAREWSYRERRNEILLALVDKEADRLDKAVDEFGAFFDHLRRVGIRGFVAENVHPDPIANEIATRAGAP